MSDIRVVELSTPFQIELLALVINFVEQSARAFGLGGEAGMAITLAVEEIYSYLAMHAAQRQHLRLTCRDGGFYMEVTCRFSGQPLPAKVMNITATVDIDDERSLGEMGLLLANRAVDQMYFVTDDATELHLIKHKKYPASAKLTGDLLVQGDDFRICNDPEYLKQFASRASSAYPHSAPRFFSFPGKVVDMIASGEYDAIVYVNHQGDVGGGMMWCNTGRMIEAYGPYIFAPAPGLPQAITEACLRSLSRSKAVCLVLKNPTPQTPLEYFEPLGRMTLLDSRGNQSSTQALYRQLTEDNGAISFVHARLVDFLSATYRELSLPRQLQEIAYLGEKRSPHSAFSVEMDRDSKTAIVSPLWIGEDAADNLARHIDVLRQEGMLNIFFIIDAGISEHAALTEALLDSGFIPKLVLPWGGRGDLIHFAYAGEGE